ncbi:hypothetical protein QBC43DRAFT_287165 [Cladorrhinum sp. PSN259]|nr:hypothetical protein QBC43DRAFT_287165 [Cladorrhinum sp. PSN259]
MQHSLRIPSTLILYSILLLPYHSILVHGAQCYGINGQKISATQCNATATGNGTSHSSCCDESKQEACLSSGLCFATQRGDNNTFWSQGCTDPTGMDPACPSYCGRTSQFIPMPIQSSYTMLFCGSGAWCCCYDSLGMACDKTACCERNFTLLRGLGTVLRQFDNSDPGITLGLSNQATPGSPSSTGGGSEMMSGPPWMRIIPMIVSGLLGSILLATIVALGFSCSQNKRLRRQVETLQSLNMNLSTQKLRSFSGSSASSASSSRSRPSTSVTVPVPPLPRPIITTGDSSHQGAGYFPSEEPLSGENGIVRTPRTPVTAAYHHHLSMVNQAVGNSGRMGGVPEGTIPWNQGYGIPSPGEGRRPSLPIRGGGMNGARYTVGYYLDPGPTEMGQGGHGMPVSPGYEVSGDNMRAELPAGERRNGGEKW